MTEITDRHATDAERVEVVTTFERIYASLQSDAEHADAKLSASESPMDPEFAFPEYEKSEFSEAPRTAAATDPKPEDMDLDSAIALLESSGRKSPPPQTAQAAAGPVAARRDPARPNPAWTRSGKPNKRYAVPAVAVALFLAVGAGYLVIQHERAATAAPEATARTTSLKLDYDLDNPRASSMIARDAH